MTAAQRRALKVLALDGDGTARRSNITDPLTSRVYWQTGQALVAAGFAEYYPAHAGVMAEGFKITPAGQRALKGESA